MADSCSNWWHCPFYFAMSLTLALIAISASKHSPLKPNHQIPPPRQTPLLPDNLSSAASLALRNHGFAATATLLQISPELLHSSPESTLFAINDSAFSTISAHPDSMKQLLNYHTCPSKLSIKALSKNPNGTCFSTLVPHKNIVITKIDQKQGRPTKIEINNVLVSHPDLFIGGPIAIHGVIGPFSSLPANETDREWEISQPSVCNSSSKISSTGEFKNAFEWDRIVGFMSSSGYVSFAVRLRSVLDGILVDYPELSTVTIFAPLDFFFVAPSWPLLERMVRFHIVPRRLTFVELASLPESSILSTLVEGRSLVITRNGYSERRRVVAVDGVEVVAPDSFSSTHFVVHGISGAFSMGELPSL